MMNTQEENQSYIYYFARKLSKEILEEINPDAPSLVDKPQNPVGESLASMATRFGSALRDILKNSLFSPRNKSTKGMSALSFKDVPNIYGYFIVTMANGEITVLGSDGIEKIPSNAQVYIVADLINLPIARVDGELNIQGILPIHGRQTLTNYCIDLWLDPGFDPWDTTSSKNPDKVGEKVNAAKQRVGRFLQAYMQGRDSLTLKEFINEAKSRISPLVNAALSGRDLNSDIESSEAIGYLQQSIIRQFGLSSSITLRPGSQVFHHHVTLDEQTISAYQRSNNNEEDRYDASKNQLGWECSNYSCRQVNPAENNFCENCGSAKPSIIKQHTRLGRRLLSGDGDELVIDITFLSYGVAQIPYDEVAIKCIETLRPYCRSFTATRISEPDNIIKLSRLLNNEFSDGRHGPIGEFSIIDFRTNQSDWILHTRAKVTEQLRKIQLDQSEIEVSLSAIALRESQLNVARRSNEIIKDELANEVNYDRIQKATDNDYYKNEADSDIERAKIQGNRDYEIGSLGRELKRKDKQLDWEELQDDLIKSRDGEVQDIRHELSLEKLVLEDEISQTNIRDAAARKRQIDELNYSRIEIETSLGNDQLILDARRDHEYKDSDVEEHIARLRATRNLDIAAKELELDLLRKSEEQSIEQRAIIQQNEFELKRLETLARIEKEQKALYANLTPNQILAMQASELAESGAHAALNNIASADSQRDQLIAAEKEKMFERLLEMQNKSTEALLAAKVESERYQFDLMKTALDGAQMLNSKITDVQDKSIDNMQKATEKTLQTMASVAQAAASSKPNNLWQDRKGKPESVKKDDDSNK